MSGTMVCLPVEPPAQGGGGFRFLRLFQAELDRRGIGWTRRIRDGAPVLFVNSWQTPARTILAAALFNPNVTVVHRVDGAAQDYGRTDGADDTLARVNRLADLTIFQSAYAKWATRNWRVIQNDGPIISNPVDLAVFSPDGPRLPRAEDETTLAVVNWSTNRMKGWPEIYRVAGAHPEVRFLLCGRFPEVPALPNLRPLGVLDAPHLAEALRTCDALLTFAKREACPNHVIEAMACGLPILYGAGETHGAIPELVEDCGIPVMHGRLQPALDRLTADRLALSRLARAAAVVLHSPEVIFRQYLDAIARARRTVDGPARVLAMLRRVTA